MTWLLKKWLFYPLAVLYLMFGIWYGSLNYKIFENPENYSYAARLWAYPASTTFREGRMCLKKDNSCLFDLDRHRQYKLNKYFVMPAMLLGMSSVSGSASYVRTTYITMISLFWPIKIVMQAIAWLLIWLLPAVLTSVIVLGAFSVMSLLAIVANLITTILVGIFGFLL